MIRNDSKWFEVIRSDSKWFEVIREVPRSDSLRDGLSVVGLPKVFENLRPSDPLLMAYRVTDLYRPSRWMRRGTSKDRPSGIPRPSEIQPLRLIVSDYSSCENHREIWTNKKLPSSHWKPVVSPDEPCFNQMLPMLISSEKLIKVVSNELCAFGDFLV